MLTLSERRRAYTPKIPLLLQDPRLVDFQKVETPETASEIAALFPQTSSFSALVGVKGKTPQPSLKVGVMFSGGPAPGGHNVVAGIFDTLAKSGGDHQLLGFFGGPSALISGDCREIKAADIAPYRNHGGFDLLGSGRTKIQTPEQFEAVLKTIVHFPPLLKLINHTPVIDKALVDLKSSAFQRLQKSRSKWMEGSLYRSPGPLQFEGSVELVDSFPQILQR